MLTVLWQTSTLIACPLAVLPFALSHYLIRSVHEFIQVPRCCHVMRIHLAKILPFALKHVFTWTMNQMIMLNMKQVICNTEHTDG